jgi:hypothetical protein
MDSTLPRTDDYTCRTTSQSHMFEEVTMFQDSLSEGHIYYGRFAFVVSAIAVLAFLLPHL